MAKKTEKIKTYSQFNRFLTAAQNGDLPKGTKLIVNLDDSEFQATVSRKGEDGEVEEHAIINTPLDTAMTALMKAAGASGKVTFANA